MSKNANGYTPHGKEVGRIILTEFLRIGDRVEMAVPGDDEGWTIRKVTNGIQGTVIGFKRYTTYSGRINFYTDKPGKYERNGAAIVKWDSGEFDTPSCHDLVFVDATLREGKAGKQSRSGFQDYREAFNTAQYLGPLPELPFWEWDICTTVDDRSWPSGTLVRISSIDYSSIGDYCTDGVTPIPIYDITPVDNSGGTMRVRPDYLTLFERGAVWKWHNDRENLRFESLRDEVSLHFALGLVDQVVNPETKNYHWPKDDVLKGAQKGLVDVLCPTMFSNMIGYKIRDAELSKRSNAELLKGFENV